MQDPHVVVFTAIGKTGSQTMAGLFNATRHRTRQFRFRVVSMRGVMDGANSTARAAALARAHSMIEAALKSPIRHVIMYQGSFPNLPPDPRIAYISVVRRPVDRCVSDYYYGHFGHENALAYAVIDAPSRYAGASLDVFVASASEHRFLQQYPRVFQGLTFCGWSDACESTRGELADSPELEARVHVRGSANMVSRYMLVGVSEDLRTMAQLLEIKLPAHFAGALGDYESLAWRHVARGQHPDYVLPNASSSATLNRLLTYDAALYAQAHARFSAQHTACSRAGH